MSSPKRWPKVPRTEPMPGCWGGWDYGPATHDTACKHGGGDCEDCGTTDRRDVLHSTDGGTGKVGRLFKKGKK